MQSLKGMRIAVVADDGFEESELTEPVRTLREAAAEVKVISESMGEIRGVKHLEPGAKVKVDGTVDELDPDKFDAVMLPGGAVNADKLRVNKTLGSFLKRLQEQGKPIAAICHAPWELVSAGLARGRTMTSYHTIQDDLRNAGANWLDQEVVLDGNLLTSRQPTDLPAFNQAMVQLFARSRGGTQHGVHR